MTVDRIHRFMTPEGTFRFLALRATQAVQTAVGFANASPEVATLLGDLLMGGALLEHAQGPAERFQAQLEHHGGAGVLVVDVRPGPLVRARAQFPQGRPGLSAFAEPAMVHVTRQPELGPGRFGSRYQSSAPVQGSRIDSAFQQYVLESEQVLTVFALATVLGDEGGSAETAAGRREGPTVLRAGGLVVQALPGFEREHLLGVTQCLEAAPFEDLVRGGMDPLEAAAQMFAPLKVRKVGEDPFEYRCTCSREAAIRMVGLLEADERRHLEQGGAESVTCEFCGTTYAVALTDLDALPTAAE